MAEPDTPQDPPTELPPGLLVRLEALALVLGLGMPSPPAQAAVAEIFGPIASCDTCGGQIALVEASVGSWWRHLSLADLAEPHAAFPPASLRVTRPADWLWLSPELGDLVEKLAEEQDSVTAAQETGENHRDAESNPERPETLAT